ncbi:MAG: hypothetical protein AAFQ07_14330 [Chloroflexota bacterium]
MTDTMPVYRAALKDSSHPMYSIAWDLFRKKFNTEKVAQRHADRRDEILPFLYTILDTEELLLDTSLGEGFAPINAVQLLGQWQVVEAIPRLLTYLMDDDDDEIYIINDRASYALQQMPPEAIDPVLEFGQEEAHAMDAMFILTEIGKGDERCFEFICSVFERQTHEIDIIAVAESLAINNLDKAEVYLQEQGRKKRYRRYRSDFERIIAEVRRGDWE